MTLIFDQLPSPQLATLRKVTDALSAALDATDAALKAEQKAKAAARTQPHPLEKLVDQIEDKMMATTAMAAAASGTPDQVKAMLAKARAKALRGAAGGADTASLEAMVRQMEHLAKIAEANHEAKKRAAGKGLEEGSGAAAIPAIVAVAPPV